MSDKAEELKDLINQLVDAVEDIGNADNSDQCSRSENSAFFLHQQIFTLIDNMNEAK